MIEINGEDGGGQILRSALSMSMITGQAFRMVNIRGKRSKPGLMRQHLTCVNASLEVCGGAASGNEMHSTELVFKPGEVKAGDYVFRIGTAGSTTLLFQTLLPALMLADGVSNLELHGGTHNPMAPSADFIKRAFLPQIRVMGVEVNFDCVRYGFAPAGGGCIKAEITPVAQLSELSIIERGERVSRKVMCLLANVRKAVGEKEVKMVKSLLNWPDDSYELKICDDVDGSGNLLYIEEVYENSVFHLTSHGMHSKSAEKVAAQCVKSYKMITGSQAAVETRLVDQLLLPMALAGSGQIKTVAMSNHILTNIKLIEKFRNITFSLNRDLLGEIIIEIAAKH